MTHPDYGNWMNVLEPLLESPYVTSLNYFLKYQYLNNHVYPQFSNVYSAFHKCKYEDLKVIIITDGMYSNTQATGLPFAIEDIYTSRKLLPPALKMIEATVNREEYNDSCESLAIDVSMESWAEQGILLLNTGLTVLEGNPNSHDAYWITFIGEVLSMLSREKSGLIYLTWGSKGKTFEKYINKNLNYVFHAEHPLEPLFKNNNLWQCDHFTGVNALLSKHEQIIW